MFSFYESLWESEWERASIDAGTGRARINQRLQNIPNFFMSIIIEMWGILRSSASHANISVHRSDKATSPVHMRTAKQHESFTMDFLDRKSDFNKNILIREISAYMT